MKLCKIFGFRLIFTRSCRQRRRGSPKSSLSIAWNSSVPWHGGLLMKSRMWISSSYSETPRITSSATPSPGGGAGQRYPWALGGGHGWPGSRRGDRPDSRLGQTKARFLDVASRGLFGFWPAKALIPVDAIIRISDQIVCIDQTHLQVAAAPRYDPDLSVRDMGDQGYVGDIYRHYGFLPYK